MSNPWDDEVRSLRFPQEFEDSLSREGKALLAFMEAHILGLVGQISRLRSLNIQPVGIGVPATAYAEGTWFLGLPLHSTSGIITPHVMI
jgi:hypothetical protein